MYYYNKFIKIFSCFVQQFKLHNVLLQLILLMILQQLIRNLNYTMYYYNQKLTLLVIDFFYYLNYIMYYYNYDLATNYELVNVFKLHNVLLLSKASRPNGHSTKLFKLHNVLLLSCY